ncbi:MAG: hypothetical protein ACTHM6_01930 [Tepidisphaeraceae bacterium]
MEGQLRPTPGPARAGRIILLILLLLGIVGVVCDDLPSILRQDLFQGDAAQHTWWTYRFDDPDLFPHDRAYDYYSLPAFSPYGYQTYMRVLVKVFDAQRLAETTGMLLALLSLWLTSRLGRAIGGTSGAIAAVAVFIAFNIGHIDQGGFPRSFALPLFLAGILAVCRRKWTLLGLVLMGVAVFYPPLVFNLVPVVGIVLLIGIVRTRRLPRGFWMMCLFSSVAVVVLGTIYLRPLPDWVGRWVTYNEARHMAEWSRFGRTAFFRPWKSFYFYSSTSGIGMTEQQAYVGAAILLACVILIRRAVTLEAWAVLLVGFGMWAFAHATLFKLYLPSRYLSYALPVFAMLWAAGLARELRLRFARFINRPNVRTRRFIVGAVGVISIAWGGVLASRAMAVYRGPPMWDVPSGYETAIRALAALPADNLIAAHPDDANGIPLRAKKSVLANTETTVAFNTAYYAYMKQRLEASFDMLYASDWSTIDAVAAKYGVKVFLLDRRRLTAPDERPYFQPFRDENKARIEAARAAGGFAMLHPPASRVLMEQGDVVLLRVGSEAP